MNHNGSDKNLAKITNASRGNTFVGLNEIFLFFPGAKSSVPEEMRIHPEDASVVFYMASKSKNWTCRVKDVQNVFGWGRDKTQACFGRLRKAGFARLSRGGEGGGGGYQLSQERFKNLSILPDAEEERPPENPVVEDGDPLKTRQSDLSTVGKPGTLLKEGTNSTGTISNTKEKKETKEEVFSFDDFYLMLDMRKGNKKKAEERWAKLSDQDKEQIRVTLPGYVKRTYRAQYGEEASKGRPTQRKQPEYYLTSYYWISAYEEMMEEEARKEAEEQQPNEAPSVASDQLITALRNLKAPGTMHLYRVAVQMKNAGSTAEELLQWIAEAVTADLEI